jgi:hypothetical protein
MSRDFIILGLRKKDALDRQKYTIFHQAADPDLAGTEAAKQLLLYCMYYYGQSFLHLTDRETSERGRSIPFIYCGITSSDSRTL